MDTRLEGRGDGLGETRDERVYMDAPRTYRGNYSESYTLSYPFYPSISSQPLLFAPYTIKTSSTYITNNTKKQSCVSHSSSPSSQPLSQPSHVHRVRQTYNLSLKVLNLVVVLRELVVLQEVRILSPYLLLPTLRLSFILFTPFSITQQSH
jgi:hypothetical protein